MKLPIQRAEKSARITRRTDRGWKDGAVTEQREKLLELRAAVSERVRQLTGEACEETPNYSMHTADAATDSFDRDLTLGLVSFEQEALYEIDAALKRIEAPSQALRNIWQLLISGRVSLHLKYYWGKKRRRIL